MQRQFRNFRAYHGYALTGHRKTGCVLAAGPGMDVTSSPYGEPRGGKSQVLGHSRGFAAEESTAVFLSGFRRLEVASEGHRARVPDSDS